MSTECERVFSRIILILVDERRSLSPEAVETELLLFDPPTTLSRSSNIIFRQA